MELDNFLQAGLRQRVEYQIDLERIKDVEALYQMIDPAIRRRLAEDGGFEPERTISAIRQFVDQVRSARFVGLDIEASTRDGGPGRGHRPTAIVLAKVVYNDRPAATVFRTPWVLDNNEWYTTATGKIGLSNAQPSTGDL